MKMVKCYQRGTRAKMKNIITGTYKYQIDPKGRVRIPAKVKEMLGKDLLIGYGAGDYLVVYTEDMVDKIYDKYADIEVYDGDEYDSVREIFSNMFPFTCDQQDRYQIPAEMRENVNLIKDIVFVGVVNKLEIWSEEAFSSRKNKSVSQSRMQDFKALK